MTDPEQQGLQPAPPPKTPAGIDDADRKQVVPGRQRHDVAQLRREVLTAAEREAVGIVTAARAEIRRVIADARQELRGLAAEMEATADPGQDAGSRQMPPTGGGLPRAAESATSSLRSTSPEVPEDAFPLATDVGLSVRRTNLPSYRAGSERNHMMYPQGAQM